MHVSKRFLQCTDPTRNTNVFLSICPMSSQSAHYLEEYAIPDNYTGCCKVSSIIIVSMNSAWIVASPAPRTILLL